MASSKRCAGTVSRIASFAYFIIIIFQVPLFRVPCRTGTCTSPVEVICSQFYVTKFFPDFGVKALLYPGAIAKAYVKSKPIPAYSNLLKQYNFSNLRNPSATTNLQHLEIVAGSYLAVAGAPLGLIGRGRLSLFGALLILWGYARQVILRESAYRNAMNVHIYLGTMFSAALCAFLSIRKDVRKLIHGFRPRRVGKGKYM